AHFRAIAEATNLPLYAYDIPVCVNVKLPVDMLMRLAADGVIAGVKDSSGDDVAFRWLCQANEDAGHPLRIFTGHEVVVDGAYLSGADGSVPGLGTSILMPTFVSGMLTKITTGKPCAPSRTVLHV